MQLSGAEKDRTGGYLHQRSNDKMIDAVLRQDLPKKLEHDNRPSFYRPRSLINAEFLLSFNSAFSTP